MGKPPEEIGASNGRRAVFLDRDGVINRSIVRNGESCPPWSLDEFEILPGVAEACAQLKEAGYVLVVATNQPDVGRGVIPQSTVEMIHSLMLEKLPINRVEVCYHPGRGMSDCDCRKPRPGMLIRAAKKLGINLEQSWMVGDRYTDIECGHAAGCRTVLVGGGYNEELQITPDFQAQNLREAAAIILR